jgi:DNA-binding GntR family transcriptional regulator
MNTKEELTKLIMASYDQGVKDAQQEALATLEQLIAAVRADEREACAKVCEDSVEYAGDTLATAIRARGEA